MLKVKYVKALNVKSLPAVGLSAESRQAHLFRDAKVLD
ncbi:MAG: hypothetical protein RL407_520 [Bacteroidota bacterium]|jgi:hypothetical protein